MAQALDREGITSYPEWSRRGGHLWLFTTRQPGQAIRRFGQGLIEEHNLTGVELYPKQSVLRDGPGSLVRLPLGVHQLTGQRSYLLALNGEPLASTIREQMALLARPHCVPDAYIEKVLCKAPPVHDVIPAPAFSTQHEVACHPDAPLSERLKARINVYDFVGQYVELDHSGKGHCPLHDDQHQSFSVNRCQNYWFCFAGCGGGSIIDFHMKWRETYGQDPAFKATVKALAEMLL